MSTIEQLCLEAFNLRCVGPVVPGWDERMRRMDDIVYEADRLAEEVEENDRVLDLATKIRELRGSMVEDRHDSVFYEGMYDWEERTTRDVVEYMKEHDAMVVAYVGATDDDDVPFEESRHSEVTFYTVQGEAVDMDDFDEGWWFASFEEMEFLQPQPWFEKKQEGAFYKAIVDPSNSFMQSLQSVLHAQAIVLFDLSLPVRGTRFGYDSISPDVNLDWICSSSDVPVLVRPAFFDRNIIYEGRDLRNYLVVDYDSNEVEFLIEHGGFFLIFMVDFTVPLEGNKTEHRGYWIRVFPEFFLTDDEVKFHGSMIGNHEPTQVRLHEMESRSSLYLFERPRASTTVSHLLRAQRRMQREREEFLIEPLVPRNLFRA